MAKQEAGIKVIAENKKAFFNYEIKERFEAGIVLKGSEIKSLREGKISLQESYIRISDGEMYLLQANITEYSHSNDTNYEPTRKRKLLMHKKEINKLSIKVDQKGLTIVPLKVYLKCGYAKLEIALAKGKNAPDKRKAEKDRELNLEAKKALKFRNNFGDK